MKAKTIVVIGSGPAGEVSAKDVDQHIVVRLWNNDWQQVERYGSRYDYGLITTQDDARLATRRPAKGWLFYNVPSETLVPAINGLPVTLLNHARWFQRAVDNGGRSADGRALKFTRGFAAVAGTIECLRPKRAIVIGMDILRNGFTGAKYYDPSALPFYVKSYPKLARAIPQWAADEMPPGLRGEGPHDYTAESVLIRELATEAGTELVWGF